MEGGHAHEVLDKFRHFEKLRLPELKRSRMGGKRIPTSRLEKVARDRLVELELDDVEDIFEFHVTGERRVWAIDIDNVFYLLWWDPRHEVCKSVLKHT